MFRKLKSLFGFSSKSHRSVSRKESLNDLLSFLEQSVYLPNQSQLIKQRVSEFKKKTVEEQEFQLPGLYLFIEKYIQTTSPSPHFNPLVFRRTVQGKFPGITNEDGLQLIFDDEGKQPQALLELFKEGIFNNLKNIWGQNVLVKFPQLKKNSNYKETKQLIVSIQKDLGFIRTGKVVNQAYDELANKYKDLGTFPSIINAIPIQFMSEEKIRYLDKQQMEFLFMEKINSEKANSQLLLKKNEELALAKARLEEAYQEINESAKFMTAIFNTVGEGLITIDKKGEMISFNHSAEEIWGYSHEEFKNISLTQLMPQKHRNNHEQGLLNYTPSKNSRVIGKWFELEGLRKDGTIFPLEINISETKNDNEELFFTAAIRDITERKRIQNELRLVNENLERKVEIRTQELKNTNENLQRSNQQLEEFAYIASHDLQEPLRTITSFIQLLKKRNEDQLNEEAREFMGYVVSGAVRMKTLINDLLSYSRIGSKTLESVEVDLERTLKIVKANLKIKIHEYQVQIKHESLPTIIGDPTLLIQLFQNLIDNAIKFCETDPVILIRSIEDPKWDILEVKDNGIGISEEYLNKIFIIFQRLHHDSSYEGTGIGLSICKKIMSKHNGDILVESEVGKGTSFKLYFPKGNT